MIKPLNTGYMMLEMLNDEALKHGKHDEVCRQDARGATR